jgi:hypothetical protein
MDEDDKKLKSKKIEASSRVEEFLDAVGKKTDDPVHHRILHACKLGNPTTCVEDELKKVIEEILHEN